MDIDIEQRKTSLCGIRYQNRVKQNLFVLNNERFSENAG
jgi:hypothetical protein